MFYIKGSCWKYACVISFLTLCLAQDDITDSLDDVETLTLQNIPSFDDHLDEFHASNPIFINEPSYDRECRKTNHACIRAVDCCSHICIQERCVEFPCSRLSLCT